MSTKQKKYNAQFKAKVVLDLLSGDLTLGQVCTKYKVTNKSVAAWKKVFLANASMAFDVDNTALEHKKALQCKEKEVSELHRQLGKRTAEAEWASKKLKSLDFDKRQQFSKSEFESKNILSVASRCRLLGVYRSGYYYSPSDNTADKDVLLRSIDRIYSSIPFYGYRKVHKQLKEEGEAIGVNRVNDYMKELGLKAICPSKRLNTTIANIEHKKHPYLLRNLEINRANQVWSTDITYCRVPGGFVYLAAVIDWYSKAILSWKISNIMDSSLVIGVLNDALERYDKPDIFNTDQGSQYTSDEHTQLLMDHGIQISMDGKGRATDNIVIERFWRSVKYEDIYLHEYKSISELKVGVREYVEFYNHRRFHQTLDYQKPMNVYLNSTERGCKNAA
jgi:putative transposase